MSISVFISYAMETDEHNKKVLRFANKLKMEGLDVSIFNDMKLGERLPVFMEQIDDADFTLLICTPEYYRKAKNRIGGVGYEWNIVTTNVAYAFDERKFIPILFSGDWTRSVPAWARGKFGIDYRDESKEEFQKLIKNFSEYETTKYCELLDFDDTITGYQIPQTPRNFQDNRRMTIVNEDGDEEVVDVILAFEFRDNHHEYVIYTKNEKDREGNITVYVSLVERNNGNPQLQDALEDDWERIKDLLWEISALELDA